MYKIKFETVDDYNLFNDLLKKHKTLYKPRNFIFEDGDRYTIIVEFFGELSELDNNRCANIEKVKIATNAEGEKRNRINESQIKIKLDEYDIGTLIY